MIGSIEPLAAIARGTPERAALDWSGADRRGHLEPAFSPPHAMARTAGVDLAAALAPSRGDPSPRVLRLTWTERNAHLETARKALAAHSSANELAICPDLPRSSPPASPSRLRLASTPYWRIWVVPFIASLEARARARLR
ncbi:MAG: hypothetical protein M0014_01910 [Actinomycetota bacterium]|jgi:hypothetical protein|nr:hypothetical protein [Actinomycetota bacterium]